MILEALKTTTNYLADTYKQLTPSGFISELNVKYKRDLLAKIGTILAKPNLTEDDYAQELKTLLASNWDTVKATALSYTAQPTDEVTLLLCEIATFVATRLTKPPKTILYPINCLMPGVATLRNDIDDDEQTNSLATTNLKKVLSTHVLSDSCKYLIPADQLAHLIDCDRTKRYNLYYDYESMEPTETLISNSELERLIQHSPDTKALAATQEKIIALQEESPSLLAKLERLNRHLQSNSSHGGIGLADNAATGAYQPIIDFFDFYKDLTVTQKNTIPHAVKIEIDLLYTMTTDSTVNVNATANLATCIGTRRDKLHLAIESNKAVLEAIVIDAATLTTSLTTAQNTLAAQKKAIEQGEFQEGCDNLPYSTSLLRALNVKPSVKSVAELTELMKLPLADLKNFFTDETLIAQVRAQINSIENLVVSLHETQIGKKELLVAACSNLAITPADLGAILVTFEDAEQLNEVLLGLRDVIVYQTLRNKNKLSLMLAHLSLPQTRIALEALERFLPGMISTAHDFYYILRHLSPEQCSLIFEAKKSRLLTMINNAEDFKNILAHLTPEQRTLIFEAKKTSLPGMIDNTLEFKSIIKYLSQEQRNFIFEAQKTSLPWMIYTVSDFENTVSFLSFEQRRFIFEKEKYYLPTIIRTVAEFNFVLELLSPEQRNFIFEAKKAFLPGMIKYAEDLEDIAMYLSPKQFGFIFEAKKSSLPGMISTIEHFKQIIVPLSAEQRDFIYETKKAELPGMIGNATEFRSLLEQLSLEKRSYIFEEKKATLPGMIGNAYDFMAVLEYLSLDQRNVIFEAKKNALPAMISHATEFMAVLAHSSPEQRNVIFEAKRNALPEMIRYANEFMAVLAYLSPEQRSIIFEAKRAALPAMINDAKGFMAVLAHLSPEQRSIIFEAKRAALPAMVNNATDLKDVLEHLSTEQRSLIFEVKKDTLRGMIENADDFIKILSKLSVDQANTLCETLKNPLPQFLKIPKLLTNTLMRLDTAENLIVVCKNLKVNLPDLIQTTEDLADCMKEASPTVHSYLFDNMKDKLVNPVDSTQDFNKVLTYLSVDERTEVFEKKQKDLPDFIISRNSFDQALEFLKPEQQLLIYKSLKQQLPSPKSVIILTDALLGVPHAFVKNSPHFKKQEELIDLLVGCKPSDRGNILKEVKAKASYELIKNLVDALQIRLMAKQHDLKANIHEVYNKHSFIPSLSGLFAHKNKIVSGADIGNFAEYAKKDITGASMLTLVDLLATVKPVNDADLQSGLGLD